MESQLAFLTNLFFVTFGGIFENSTKCLFLKIWLFEYIKENFDIKNDPDAAIE